MAQLIFSLLGKDIAYTTVSLTDGQPRPHTHRARTLQFKNHFVVSGFRYNCVLQCSMYLAAVLITSVPKVEELALRVQYMQYISPGLIARNPSDNS